MKLNTWTHPTTGQTRRYLDSEQVWWDMIPATNAAGYKYSGADERRVLAARFWLDDENNLHIDGLSERGRITEADVRAAVEAEIAAELAPVAVAEAVVEVEAVAQTSTTAADETAPVAVAPQSVDADTADTDQEDPMPHDDTDRMTGGELQTVREYLGLGRPDLGALLASPTTGRPVAEDTLRKWEVGKDPIPYRIRAEVEQIEADTAAAVDELATALRQARDAGTQPAVVVYRTDDELHTARPDMSHLPARWWRHVVARAIYDTPDVPGVAIGTRTELED